MRYCNAGHPPQILYRRVTGEFIELNGRGKPLGWMKEYSVEEREISFVDGDRIVLYTDGITECMNCRHELYGDDRFRSVIASHAVMDPDQFALKLLMEMREYSGSDSFNDDLTMLILDVVSI